MGVVVAYVAGIVTVVLFEAYRKRIVKSGTPFGLAHWLSVAGVTAFTLFLVAWFYLSAVEDQVRAGVMGVIVFGALGAVVFVALRAVSQTAARRRVPAQKTTEGGRIHV